MSNKKHYIITSITLGAIAMVSAIAVGATHLITKDRIALNEKNKINAGIVEIFGQNSVIFEDFDVNEEHFSNTYKYVNHVYSINDNESQKLGYAFGVSGSNMYGKISMIVGFSEGTRAFMSFYVTVNEQTYASTLEDNYIDTVNAGERDIDDVTCGATYGAKLIRDMVAEAKTAAEELWS